MLALLISSMIRKELGHQYAVVTAGNSRAMTTTVVGKGHRDDKGFREALTMLAASAGCRDQGGLHHVLRKETARGGRREAAGEKEPRQELQATTST
jgi:hypothetical protein